jgi:hypothetical protein
MSRAAARQQRSEAARILNPQTTEDHFLKICFTVIPLRALQHEGGLQS